MRVLVLGATGSIGTAVAATLRRRGHSVLALARSPGAAASVSAAGHDVLDGDLRRPEAWRDAVLEVDAIVHAAVDFASDMGAVDRALLSNLAEAAVSARTPPRFLYTGGCWLYGATGDVAATEETPFNPIASFAWMVDNAAFLAKTGAFDLAVVHPAMVYGPGGGVFSRFIEQARAGRPLEIWGGADVRWPLVNRDDLATAYSLLLERPGLTGDFNVSAEAGVRVGEIAAAIDRQIGAAAGFIVRSKADVMAEYGDWAEGPTLDQRMASTRLRAATGWMPATPDYAASDVFSSGRPE